MTRILSRRVADQPSASRHGFPLLSRYAGVGHKVGIVVRRSASAFHIH
ncbi:hypothetical protein GPX89_24795 [Nocardia sp. ET3-3]|uniref:Uncharacterized protein n=1 Tax=Nocardia terrae TaxID=2675851 RepID=A0A7K1V1J3_9NOCA|nr:hypothetical protein [Nocardia terrae]